MSNTLLLPRGRAWLAALALVAAPWLAASALAQDDPPGRVGRLAEMQGAVSWYDHEQGQWTDAERNRPLTSGDRLSTGPRATAQVRVGSTVVRLSETTELELVRIDDDRIALRLLRGSLALQVRAREVAAEIDVVTAEAVLHPRRTGLYRFDRVDETTQATALRGALRVDEREGFTIDSGQRVELWREGAGHGVLRSRYGSPVNDDFAIWITSDDRRDERTASSQYVSPEMTGAEELDRNGRWDQHPEYGAVWVPLAVRDDWAPYRYGRWAWVQPWGWTWVDDAPWGFAPFHYGRWVHWRGRWGWWPGQYVARPVYAPALVAWVGGPQLGVSIGIGLPWVSWVPLAPREVFRPYYRVTPRYEDRVNHRPPGSHRPLHPPQQVPTGPIMYGNQRAPGAVTTVPREVMVQRQPVGRAVLDSRDVMRGSLPLRQATPPLRESEVSVQPPPRGQRPAPAVMAPAMPPVAAPPVAVPAARNRPAEPDRARGQEPDRQRGAMPEPARPAPREMPPSQPRPAPTSMPAVAVQPPAPAVAQQPVQRPVQPPPKEAPKDAPKEAPKEAAQQPAAAPPPRQRAPEPQRRPEREQARKGENLN